MIQSLFYDCLHYISSFRLGNVVQEDNPRRINKLNTTVFVKRPVLKPVGLLNIVKSQDYFKSYRSVKLGLAKG